MKSITSTSVIRHKRAIKYFENKLDWEIEREFDKEGKIIKEKVFDLSNNFIELLLNNRRKKLFSTSLYEYNLNEKIIEEKETMNKKNYFTHYFYDDNYILKKSEMKDQKNQIIMSNLYNFEKNKDYIKLNEEISSNSFNKKEMVYELYLKNGKVISEKNKYMKFDEKIKYIYNEKNEKVSEKFKGMEILYLIENGLIVEERHKEYEKEIFDIKYFYDQEKKLIKMQKKDKIKNIEIEDKNLCRYFNRKEYNYFGISDFLKNKINSKIGTDINKTLGNLLLKRDFKYTDSINDNIVKIEWYNTDKKVLIDEFEIISI